MLETFFWGALIYIMFIIPFSIPLRYGIFITYIAFFRISEKDILIIMDKLAPVWKRIIEELLQITQHDDEQKIQILKNPPLSSGIIAISLFGGIIGLIFTIYVKNLQTLINRMEIISICIWLGWMLLALTTVASAILFWFKVKQIHLALQSQDSL